MDLILQVDGKKQTFVPPFVSGRMLRKTLEIQEKTDFENIKTSTLDEMVDYVVELYGGQFTRDQFYDGIESNKMFSTIQGCTASVVGMTNKSLGGIEDPNARKKQAARTKV